MTAPICYLNGEYLSLNDCSLHISDLGLLRGYGVFDFFRSRDGNIKWLADYIHRLFNSIEDSNIDISLSKKEFENIIYQLQEKNNFRNGTFRAIVTAGLAKDFEYQPEFGNIIIINRPYEKPASTLYTEGGNLQTYQYKRSHPTIKTTDYYTSYRLRKELAKNYCIDVLFHEKYIYETSRANIFFIQGQSIVTPKSEVLEGITRKQVLRLQEHGFTIHKENILSESIFDFDEIFITGSAKDIMPVVQIDKKTIGDGKPGKMTKEIAYAFNKLS